MPLDPALAEVLLTSRHKYEAFQALHSLQHQRKSIESRTQPLLAAAQMDDHKFKIILALKHVKQRSLGAVVDDGDRVGRPERKHFIAELRFAHRRQLDAGK
jgi:hypothetical protein